MRVAGRELVSPFDDFWREFGPEVPVPLEHIEEGLSSVFGDKAIGATAPAKPDWLDLPDDDLAYHVAHELTHIVLRQRGFPKTGRGSRYAEDSAEARVGADLEEIVLHPALEALIEPFGFRRNFIVARMVDGASRGISRSAVPDRGTPWFFTWAIRYCGLQLELPERDWLRLEPTYRERAPRVCDLGEELVAIMREAGWGSREQALEAMIRTRDALGLGVDGRVLVIDPIGDEVL